MRLLFAHAFIGLVIVAIGIAVQDPFPVYPSGERVGSKKGFDDAGLTYHVEISGFDLAGHSGRYHVDPNFREEFSNFRSIDLPASESDFMTHAHGLSDTDELETAGHWKIKSLVIEGESVTLQTTAYNDESYVFAGTIRFDVKCSFGTIHLTGQLTKIRDDVVAGTTNVEFHKVCGC